VLSVVVDILVLFDQGIVPQLIERLHIVNAESVM